MTLTWLPPILALLFSPLLLGAINRIKAWFAGRTGQPVLQTYRDIWKLLQKGSGLQRYDILGVSRRAAGRARRLDHGAGAGALRGQPALLPFTGDVVFFCALLGIARFFTIAAALDTGSSFEGMGASREALFGALGEPAIYLALAALVRYTGTPVLSDSFSVLSRRTWHEMDPALVLVAVALLGVFLVENCRIPVDDPNTHLELTMIHEVMVLDHGGPDLAFVLYGSALRMWLLGSLLAGIVVPAPLANAWANLGLGRGCAGRARRDSGDHRIRDGEAAAVGRPAPAGRGLGHWQPRRCCWG